MIEFLSASIERRHRGSQKLFYGELETGQRRSEPLELDRKLIELLSRAYKSQAEQRDFLARALFRTAGNRALRLFDGIPQDALTPYGIHLRASYGELGIIALREAGDLPRAEEFARRFSQDRLTPINAQVRVMGMFYMMPNELSFRKRFAKPEISKNRRK